MVRRGGQSAGARWTAQAWRAETPKEKFVLVNLPFERLYIAPMTVKKTKVMALLAEEPAGASSAVLWHASQVARCSS